MATAADVHSEAQFFPTGTTETYQTCFAPADFIETVDTLGLEVYAKQKTTVFDRGVEIHTQSNPLPMCMRPAVQVKGTCGGPNAAFYAPNAAPP